MTTMTAQDREQVADHVREEVRRTQRLAHEAVDALDIAVAVALCRSLRSLVWRAQSLKFDLTDPATVIENPAG